MSFIFGHLIGAWLMGKASEYASNKELSHYTWFFLLMGGVIPDADLLLDWTMGVRMHRTFTHSLLFLIFLSVLIYFVLSSLKHKESKILAFALGTGITVHIIQDMALSQGVPLLWPSMLLFSFRGISLFDPATLPFLEGSAFTLKNYLKAAIIDMALGVMWIFYLWFRKRVKF